MQILLLCVILGQLYYCFNGQFFYWINEGLVQSSGVNKGVFQIVFKKLFMFGILFLFFDLDCMFALGVK